MLIEFSLGNFRSFKEIQTLSLTASNLVSRYPKIDQTNVFEVNDKYRLLKSKAIYGANASGKSNLIKGLVVFIRIINKSVKDNKTLKRNINNYLLSSETDNQPSFFQMVFLLDGTEFRYGFEANQDEIISEWLFGRPNVKELEYFTREKNEINVNASHFKEGDNILQILGEDSENEIVRKNALFLTSVASLNGKLSKSIVDYISGFVVMSGLKDHELIEIAEQSLLNEERRVEIAELLKKADIGISDISTIQIPDPSKESKNTEEKEVLAITTHKYYDENNNETGVKFLILQEGESEGTKKIFEMSPALIYALKEGRPVFIDELDARLHPLLTRKIVELFNSNHTNKNNAQLVFITHDTNLLSSKLLRRDQISFVEKDQYGASHLYSLADLKGVRNDASYEKDYINGKYGAIPFLGDLEDVFD